jgi:hypothetical protein
MIDNSNKKSKQKYLIMSICGVIILLFAVLAVLEFTNTTHFFHKASPLSVNSKTPTTGGASQDNQKGEPQNSSNPTSNNTTQPGDSKNSVSGTATTSLEAPSGDFVSNHRPNLSGSPAPNIISSVCTTTPGATCTINFTKDGVTKSLTSQTTDRGGSSYWNWTLQEVGISSGTWKIQALATLNGKSKSTNDALDLVVSQ